MYRFPVLILFSATVFHLARCDIYRLPKNVKPLRYILTMEPHLEADLLKPVPYNGSVVMELKVLENTKNVTFHKKGFEIDVGSITIISSSGDKINLHATLEDEESEIYTIQLENELIKDESYKLTIDNFFGILGTEEGFFLVKYYTKFPYLRGLAVTHFEPTGARTAFPCFDEPAIKSTFIINLIRREGYNSVSNEELQKTKDIGDGRFKDTFKETPLMSTYLVAFAVSDYKPTEKLERHRIFVKSASVDDDRKNYSMEVSIKILKILEEYTGINFTISKMDQFALPAGVFKVYAMENWGLVIYGADRLFYEFRFKRSPQDSKKLCTLVIAHEFAHQWFGNLVTPQWWDYIWLAESFAAYFQYHIAATVQPSWRLEDQFVIDMVQKAFLEEEKRGAYPITYRIQRSGQYPPFHIMYEKGSSILRMVKHFVTPEVFRRGLQIYLQKGQFSTVLPSDLYSALQEAVDNAGVNHLLSNLTVAEIFETWENSPDFPIVTVTRNYTTGGITIQQESLKKKTGNWIIPVNYVFSADENPNFSETTADFWLTEKSATINHDFPTNGWLVVNKQQTGYYRVNYDSENWERIIQFLNSDNFTSIHVLNRAQLLDDSFNLGSNKIIPFDIPLRLSEYLRREKDFIPWTVFRRAVGEYVGIYSNSNNKKNYQYDFFEKYSYRNESLSEYDCFQNYIRNVTSGLRGYLKTIAKADNDSYVDSLNRYETDRYFPYYFVSN